LKSRSKTTSQKTLFEIFNTLKQKKIDLLNSKTLLKVVTKALRKMRIFALRKLIQNSPKEWIYIAHS